MIRIAALLAAALAIAAPSTGTYLYYGPGSHTPAQTTFTAADQPVTILCAGPAQTTLMLPAGGLEFTYDSEFAAPSVNGCTLATDAAGGGTAITVTGPVLPSATQHGPKLRNLSIRGDNVQ